LQARKNTLWQPSTENQLRNFAMLSFRDTEGRSSDKSTLLKDRKQAQRVADTSEMAAQRKKSEKRTVFWRHSRKGDPFDDS
jgi:hypothetical protein